MPWKFTFDVITALGVIGGGLLTVVTMLWRLSARLTRTDERIHAIAERSNEMVPNGGNSLRDRVDQVRATTDRIERHIDNLDTQQDRTERRVDELDHKITVHIERSVA